MKPEDDKLSSEGSQRQVRKYDSTVRSVERRGWSDGTTRKCVQGGKRGKKSRLRTKKGETKPPEANKEQTQQKRNSSTLAHGECLAATRGAQKGRKMLTRMQVKTRRKLEGGVYNFSRSKYVQR